jgi:hypothetical protein
MKVQLDLITKALIGKVGKLVFYLIPKSNVLLARAYKKPKYNITNKNLGQKSTNLSRFYHSVSAGYHADLVYYATQLNVATVGQPCVYNAYNVFVKMMYSLKQLYPEIDLKTITPQQVIDDGLPIVTLCQAVENEVLPTVPNYDVLVHGIV